MVSCAYVHPLGDDCKVISHTPTASLAVAPIFIGYCKYTINIGC